MVVVEATTGGVVVVVVSLYSRTGVVVTTTTGTVLPTELWLDPKVVWTLLTWGDTEGSCGPIVGLKRGDESSREDTRGEERRREETR